MGGYGLLGRKLGHSYSPAIHSRLAGYNYQLYEREPEQLESFLRKGGLSGMNVTIPYKKAVVPFLDSLSPAAGALGSVNTILRREDGSLFGDNTDLYGFLSTVRRSGVDPAGRKALVLGSGGASVTVCEALRQLGAGEVRVISRSGEDNYRNISRHHDAEIIVNATPVGMYPGNGESPLDLSPFSRLLGVFDLIYNPERTALLLQAEELGIPAFGGLHMLVAQAKRSCEIFTGRDIPDGRIDEIREELSRQMRNIVIIGMPGSGKSTIAGLLGERLGRQVLDSDQLVEQLAGRSIPEIFSLEGEEGFRRRETEALRQLGGLSGAVIATGGGCVTRKENYPLLHQNGRIVWITRGTEKLPREGRPISQRSDLDELFAQREPLYRRFADCVASNDGSPEQTVEQIIKEL